MSGRRGFLILGYCLVILILHLWGTFSPNPAMWSVMAWHFLPRGLFMAVLAGCVAIALAPLAVPSGSRAAPTRAAGVFSEWAHLLPLLIGAAVLFWFVRQRSFLMSDSQLLLLGYKEGGRHFTADSVAVGFLTFLRGFDSSPPSESAAAAFQLASIAAGLLWTWLIYKILRLWFRAGTALLLLLVFLTSGVVRLFAGYVETSPLLAAAVAGFLLAGLKSRRGECPTVLLCLAFVAVSAIHLVGWVLFPAFVFVLFSRPIRKGRAAAWLAGSMAISAFIFLAASGRLSPSGAGEGPAAGHGIGNYLEGLIPVAGPLGSQHAYHLFSLAHFQDLLNEHIALGPCGLLLLIVLGVASLAGARGRPADGDRRINASATDLDNRFLLLALIPWFLFSFVFHRKLGGARDWDLFANVEVIALLLLARNYLFFKGNRGGLERHLVPVIIAVSFLHTSGFGLTDHRREWAEPYFEYAFTPGEGHLSRFARSYAWQELGMEAIRDKSADAQRWLERAVEADTTNGKAAATLGSIYAAQGDAGRALLMYQRGARFDPGQAYTHLNIGVALAKKNEFAGAEAAFREALKRDPTLTRARAYLVRVLIAEGRKEEARSELELLKGRVAEGDYRALEQQVE